MKAYVSNSVLAVSLHLWSRRFATIDVSLSHEVKKLKVALLVAQAHHMTISQDWIVSSLNYLIGSSLALASPAKGFHS